jgi:hypothetical protein
VGCGLVGAVIGVFMPEAAADYLNVQANDFNVIVDGPIGPIYFNFQHQIQSSGKPGVPTFIWIQESLR